jgi:hypothetical protein
MDAEICALLDRSDLIKSSVIEIAARLPADDAELDHWLEVTATEKDAQRFFPLLVAAIHAERPVDARHLAGGLMLVPHHSWVGPVVWKANGDAHDHVTAAVRDTPLSMVSKATALFAAALKGRARDPEAITPPALIAEARHLARERNCPNEARTMLHALASLSDDEGLHGILSKDFTAENYASLAPLSRKMVETSPGGWDIPILEIIRESPANAHTIARGATMRRAVERIGRNDPCPCGSGQKYKRCCFDKDQERLRHSSDIRGKTVAEVRADIEQHLTDARLTRLRPHEVARLDPLKIPAAMRESYFLMLMACGLFARFAESYELLGRNESLRELLDGALWHATLKGRRDDLLSLIAVHPRADVIDDHVHIATALLRVRGDSARMLELAEENALATLKVEDNPEDTMGFAYGLMLTPGFRAIGILVARGVLPRLPRARAVELLDRILHARDELHLPPEESSADLLDQRFVEALARAEGRDAEALRSARRELERKAGEARRMKDELAQLRREIERREKTDPAPPPTAEADAPPPQDARLRELRERLSALKASLKERTEERASLRRALQQSQLDLEKLREQGTAPQTVAAPQAEDDAALLLPGDLPGQQPVRTIDLPRKFSDTLRSFSKPVARAAMVAIGRLAAGEPTAYVGVVRLKECPDVYRQRIGIDHRLLFRLHADSLEVVDLINRRDLERRIKTLPRGIPPP